MCRLNVLFSLVSQTDVDIRGALLADMRESVIVFIALRFSMMGEMTTAT